MECIFCKIINGEITSYTIYEDEIVKAFLDVNPDSNGHTLIIPNKHYLDLYEIPNDVLMHCLEVAKKLGRVYEEKLGVDGITLVQNNGNVQEVKHFHLHVKPQYNNKSDIISVQDVYKKITN